MKKLFCLLIAAVIAASSYCVPIYAQTDNIVTDNLVEIEQSVSKTGFVHPGIGFNAETIETMRNMVKSGTSPWVDYFEGMRRTKYAKLDAVMKKQEQITNNTGINNFANDAQTAWVQAMLYYVTGDEQYRRIPVELINWYGGRTDFFPEWFSDSHIKLGKYVYTFCAAAELMRSTTPKDESLAVTQEMIDKFDENCLRPISDKCLSRKDYFMNQLNYSVQGYLAESILVDDKERYADAVEMTTVNAGYTENPARRGSIQNIVRYVTANEETGEACEPHYQHAEMGRDQDHAKGNTDNFILISRTTDIQNTKVDPKKGTVTEAADGVSVTKFLDDSIIRSAELYFEYNLGYDIPWTPIYGENDGKNKVTVYREPNGGYRGKIMSTGTAAMYYRYKSMGYDLEKDYPFCAEAGKKVIQSNRDFIYTGTYIEYIHNYDFDFWTGLSAAAADGKPDAAKAARALAKELAPYEGTEENIIPLGNRFIDMNANEDSAQLPFPKNDSDKPIEQKADADGTEYAHMQLVGDDARTMVVYQSDVPKNKIGFRVRTNDVIRLTLYTNTDYADSQVMQVIAPDTDGQWEYIVLDFSPEGVRDFQRSSIWYMTAQSISGKDAEIDFDCINTSAEAIKPPKFSADGAPELYAGIKGEMITLSYAAENGVSYRADGLPDGAVVDEHTGMLSWTPQENGDYTVYVTVSSGASTETKEVVFKIRDDFEQAMQVVLEKYDPNAVYTTETQTQLTQAQEQAKQQGTRESLDQLKKAVDHLELLNPPLKYGGLDYVSVCTSTQGGALSIYADGTPANNATLSEPDMNFTMDFGNHFKIKADHFGLQPRAGFPARCLDMNVYGSDDCVNWTRLTENGGEADDRMQTLSVYEEQKNKAYRYLRLYMPNGTFRKNQNAYICDVGELRIYGERIEADTPDFHKSYIDGYDDSADGYAKGTFRPDNHMTRAEAAVLLSRTLISYMDSNECECTFTDVEQDAWYIRDLAYMQKKKFVVADKDGAFRPNDEITRGEFCDMVMRVKGLKNDKAVSQFNDTKDNVNEKAIALAFEQGWINGYDDGGFHPDAPITRAEIVAIVNRMEKREPCHAVSENPFSDLKETHWAFDDIMEAANAHNELI